MDKQTFSFAQYLEVMANNTDNNKILDEIKHLKSHTANLRIMQRHFKQYQTLKSLFDSGVQIFSSSLNF